MAIAITALYMAKLCDLPWPIGRAERESGKHSVALKPDRGNTYTA